MPCFCSSERSFGEKFRAQFLLFWGVLGYTGLLVSMESDHVLRETQLKIVYAVVAVFVCYYAITALIPWGVHIIQIELDKRRVINVLRDEIHDTTNAESQLKEYKHAKVQPECIANIAKRKPNFVLSTNPIPAGIASKDRDRSSKAVEKLAAPSSTFSTQRNSQPRFNLASASSEQTSLNRQERDLVDPRDLANIAPRLNSGSEEDRFQRPAKRGTTLNGIVDVNDQRKLKEQQDREYRKSEERDRERLRAEQAKMEHAARVAERRKFLSRAVLPELGQTQGEDKVVGLQFRFRESASGSSSAALQQRKRIQRKFSVTRATAADLLLFVESLELRPLLSGTYELTLDFPTRVISGRSSNSSAEEGDSRTLEQLDITTDSVVWVTFSED